MKSNALQRRPVAHWLLGLVLSLGGAVVWLLALKIVTAMIGQWTSGPLPEQRDIQYLADGEPVVSVIRYRQGAGAWEPAGQEFETLDGQPISPTSEQQSNVSLEHWRVSYFTGDEPASFTWLRLAPFQVMRDPYSWRRKVREPFSWAARLQIFHEQSPSRMPTWRWFFVWPERREGTGYFVGYDLKTKVRLGYLGTAGFSPDLPPESQQFPAWSSNGTRLARLVADASERNSESSGTLPVHDPQAPFEAGLYFVTPDRDRAYRISFTKRTVQLVRREQPSAIEFLAVRTIYDPQGYSKSAELLLRFHDRLEFVNHALQTQQVLPLPEELRETSFSLTKLKVGGFLAQHATVREAKIVGQSLWWLDDQGQITKRTEIALPSRSWTLNAWQDGRVELIASLMPIGGLKLLALAPITPMLDESGQWLRKPGERLTVSTALRAMDLYVRRGGGGGWTALVVSLLCGAPFAALCGRKLNTAGAAPGELLAWMLLVYVFGLVGWIALVTHREWPKKRSVPTV